MQNQFNHPNTKQGKGSSKKQTPDLKKPDDQSKNKGKSEEEPGNSNNNSMGNEQDQNPLINNSPSSEKKQKTDKEKSFYKNDLPETETDDGLGMKTGDDYERMQL